MKIKLNNFCGISGEYNFGESGIVLISGKSGVGKTTIVDAVYFSLFGNGSKVSSHGKESCSVELLYGDLHIVRTKKPIRLVLNGTIEDDEAQKIIDEKFGSTFNISGYISQNSFESFILMNPIDKLTFIEKFAFNGCDILELKKKTKELIKARTDELFATTTQLDLTRGIFESKTKPESKKKLYSKNIDLLTVIKNKEEYINRISKKIATLDDLLKLTTSEKNDHNMYLSEKAHILSNILNVKNKLDSLNKSLQTLNYNEEKVIETQKQIENFKRNREYNAIKELIDQDTLTLADIESKEKTQTENEIHTIKKLLWLDYSKEKVDEELVELGMCLEDIKKLEECNSNIKTNVTDTLLKIEEEKLNKYKNDMYLLTAQKDVYTCPGCSCNLKLKNGNLELHKDTIVEVQDDDTTKLKKMISDLESNVTKMKIQMEKNIEYTKKRSEILEQYDPIPSKQDILNQIKEWTTYKNQHIEYENKLQQLQSKKQSEIVVNFKKRIEQRKKTLSTLTCNQIDENFNEDDSYKFLNEQEKIKHTVQSIEKQKSDLEKERKEQEKILDSKKNKYKTKYAKIRTSVCIDNNIKNLNNKIAIMKAILVSVGDRIKNIREYIQFQKELDDYTVWETKVKNLEEKEKENKKRLTSSSIFRDKILEAESISISNFINSLNNHAQTHLDNFFTDNPISVRLLCFKETKTNMKPQINTVIEYREREFTNVNSLSGGELNRVVLAFTLALGEIFNTPLFLFDECTANLDQEMTSTVINSLKYNFSNKLILIIAHQAIEGCYDRVIQIK